MKTLALGLFVVGLAPNPSPCLAAEGATFAADASSVTADQVLAQPSRPDGGTTSPLTLDGAFNSGGLPFSNNVGISDDHNLRLFSRIGGYYLVGYHAGSSGAYESFIYSVGLDGLDGSFASHDLPFYPVDVANVTGTTRFYFTGAYNSSPTSDYDFGVFCIDFSTNAACSSFGNNGPGFVTIPIDSNGFNSDFPVKIIADGSSVLYIAGTSSSAAGLGNLDVSVAAIDPTLGSPIAGFGNRVDNPGTMVYSFDRTANAADRTTNLLVTSASSAGGHRLYVVGESQFSADGTDTDGFALAINPVTGARITTFGANGVKYVFNDLGQTNKQDSIDAMTLTRDGKLAMAGHSTDDDGNQFLSLAEIDTTGTYAAGFCGNGHCTVPILSTYDVPVDIAERSGTRDLVVATTIHDDFGTGADGHPFQAIWQFGKTGNAQHAFTVVDFPSNVAPANSNPSDVLIAFDGSVFMAGTRKSGQLGASDYDMTLTHFIDTDTIFANQFETVF